VLPGMLGRLSAPCFGLRKGTLRGRRKHLARRFRHGGLETIVAHLTIPRLNDLPRSFSDHMLKLRFRGALQFLDVTFHGANSAEADRIRSTTPKRKIGASKIATVSYIRHILVTEVALLSWHAPDRRGTAFVCE
jgi:hypothetical protein